MKHLRCLLGEIAFGEEMAKELPNSEVRPDENLTLREVELEERLGGVI